jgi:hypothetical protein
MAAGVDILGNVEGEGVLVVEVELDRGEPSGDDFARSLSVRLRRVIGPRMAIGVEANLVAKGSGSSPRPLCRR